MNKTLPQKISQFLDNDLEYEDSLELLQALQSDAELSNTLNRYAAISHVIKTGEYVTVKPGFSAAISARIQQEPHHLIATLKKPSKPSQQWFAIAASIALISVLAVNYGKHLTPQSNQASMLALAKPEPKPKAKILNKQNSPTLEQQSQEPLNKRINDYLQAHSNSIYINDEADLAPLTSVTSYRQK